jgi:hypothetical protein
LQFKWEPWLGRLCGLSRRSFLGLLVVLLLFLGGSAVVYAWNDVYPASSIFFFTSCVAILSITALVYIIQIRPIAYVSIKHWIENNENYRPRWRALCLLCGLFDLSKATDSPSRQGNYEDGLWQEYYRYGLLGHRTIRVVAIWLVFAVIETLLVYLLPPWPLPWRGNIDLPSSIDLASWMGVSSFIVTMLLLFFILDAVRLNFYWISKLRTQHPLLKERVFQADVDAYDNATKNNPAKSLEKIVSLVAERTRAVDKLIYYPMLCIMLMLFSKITYFDNQDFPLSKGITFGAAISLLFLSGFMLRHEANQLKLSVRKSLKNLKQNNDCTKEKIDKTIERIDAIDEGAFQPMLEQPVMQALLIVLASIGLFAGEYLKLFG